jgi:hypothetical protein
MISGSDSIHRITTVGHHVAPPPREDGTVRPNLFIIGAMKSGTTYLRKLLAAHPAIFMCEPDEPSYFVEPRELRKLWPDMWRRRIWQSEKRYLALFGQASSVPILGEASTAYTKAPMVSGVAARMQAFNPSARCIYIMRDPVERTISHYWHMVRYETEYREMATAIQCDPQFLAVSHYAAQLAPFLERFGREGVYTVTFEALVADAWATMCGIYTWLGLVPNAANRMTFEVPEHVTPAIVSQPKAGGIVRRVRQWPPAERVVARLPPSLHRALHRLTTKEVRRAEVDTTAVKRLLRPIHRRQTEELTKLLGREFPEWITLNESRP